MKKSAKKSTSSVRKSARRPSSSTRNPSVTVAAIKKWRGYLDADSINDKRIKGAWQTIASAIVGALDAKADLWGDRAIVGDVRRAFGSKSGDYFMPRTQASVVADWTIRVAVPAALAELVPKDPDVEFHAGELRGLQPLIWFKNVVSAQHHLLRLTWAIEEKFTMATADHKSNLVTAKKVVDGVMMLTAALGDGQLRHMTAHTACWMAGGLLKAGWNDALCARLPWWRDGLDAVVAVLLQIDVRDSLELVASRCVWPEPVQKRRQRRAA